MPRRLLFHHVPKCGGTTINLWLERNYAPEVSFVTDGWTPNESVDKFLEMEEAERYSYELVTGHGTNRLLDSTHKETLFATTLREPIERVFSFYYFLRQNTKHSLSVEANNQPIESMSFFGLTNAMTSELAICDASKYPKEALRKAKARLLRYHFVGFQDELWRFCKRLEVACDMSISHDGRRENETRNKPGPQDLSPESVAKIQQMNQLDMELYNWACEVFR